ncbi:MAG: hypothetical protein ABFC77_05470 [Thermoguttaceae bacterium]
MSAKNPAHVTKKQSILDFLAANPKASNSDVVEALRKQNVEVKASDVASIKYHAKKDTKKEKPTRTRTKGQAKARDTREAKAKRKYLQRPYPQKTLEEAIVIAQKIKEKNNGNPWATTDLGDACGYTNLRSLNFLLLTTSARDFGLTAGTNSTETIELAPLGREIAYAESPEQEQKSKIKAFFNIDIFKRVYEYYGGSNLPAEQQYVSNTLQKNFGLDVELHEEFIALFKANCTFLGIESGLDGASIESGKTEQQAGEVRVVGQAAGKFDRTAFVILPFTERNKERSEGFFSELLNKLITPAGNSAGFAVKTAEGQGSDIIQSTIINQLLQAELVIADLTDHNPNVLFELGIRIAKELPVALIRAEGTGRIFDVDNMMRVFPYSPKLWTSTIEKDLPKLTEHIKTAWDNRSTYRTYMQILTGAPVANA